MTPAAFAVRWSSREFSPALTPSRAHNLSALQTRAEKSGSAAAHKFISDRRDESRASFVVKGSSRGCRSPAQLDLASKIGRIAHEQPNDRTDACLCRAAGTGRGY